MRPSFHTLDRAFRHRRAALVENSTSFSQKLPVFAENSTTFRRKSARLHPLQPAVAAFSAIVGRHSPLIQHRFPNNPPSPLSIFAVTNSNTSATTKPKKGVVLKLAQLHRACAETVNLLLKIRNKQTHIDNKTKRQEEKAHRIVRNDKRLFNFTSHTPKIRLKLCSRSNQQTVIHL